MRPKISGSVVSTVALVAVLVGVVAALVAVQSTSRDTELSPAPSGASSSSTPRAGTGGARPSHRATLTPPGATSSQCVQPVSKGRLSVVTFNIHSARDHGGGVHLGEIADALAAYDADVYLLQEVDRYRLWTDQLDMPTLLADRLGMSWTFGNNVSRGALNHYGTAILSRYPIVKSDNLYLPRPSDTQQRGLLHAVIDVDGVELSVYDTHLESTSSAARLSQMRTIVPVLRADQRPKVFGGDLNAAPPSPVVQLAGSAMSDTWSSLTSVAGFTHPAGSPRIRIDYLFHGDGTSTQVEPLHAEILAPAVSDHRPVRATYELRTSTGEVCVPVVPEQDQP